MKRKIQNERKLGTATELGDDPVPDMRGMAYRMSRECPKREPLRIAEHDLRKREGRFKVSSQSRRASRFERKTGKGGEESVSRLRPRESW